MEKVKKAPALFCIGFIGYPVVELLWRRRTHWSMALTGGLCFIALFELFERLRAHRLWKKCVLGSLAVTCIEFAVGVVVNLRLKLDVWDYSARPLNVLGQVCPLYSLLWGLLCVPLCPLCGKLSRRFGGPGPK